MTSYKAVTWSWRINLHWETVWPWKNWSMTTSWYSGMSYTKLSDEVRRWIRWSLDRQNVSQRSPICRIWRQSCLMRTSDSSPGSDVTASKSSVPCLWERGKTWRQFLLDPDDEFFGLCGFPKCMWRTTEKLSSDLCFIRKHNWKWLVEKPRAIFVESFCYRTWSKLAIELPNFSSFYLLAANPIQY